MFGKKPKTVPSYKKKTLLSAFKIIWGLLYRGWDWKQKIKENGLYLFNCFLSLGF